MVEFIVLRRYVPLRDLVNDPRFAARPPWMATTLIPVAHETLQRRLDEAFSTLGQEVSDMEMDEVRKAAASIADEILGPNDARREELIEKLVKFALDAPALGKVEETKTPEQKKAEQEAEAEDEDDDEKGERRGPSHPPKKK